jgi:hypothetical protein
MIAPNWAKPMHDNSRTYPIDDDDWHVLVEELSVALATPFTSKSRESTKPRHAEFSFLEAMYFAVDGGTIPLARFIRDRRGRELLSEQDWQYLAVFIQSLLRPPKQRRGRPKRGLISDGAIAEEYAARLVAKSQSTWRALNRRERVPAIETKKLITRAIDKAAADFRVPAHKIKPHNVRNLLKSGRHLTHK